MKLGDKKFVCCNHPDRPAQAPSRVLCAECFDELDKKFRALKADLAAKTLRQ